MGLLKFFKKKNDINVNFINMSIKDSLTATFKVTGNYNNEEITEEVSIDKVILSSFIQRELSDYEYLNEVLKMRDNFSNYKYGDFFLDLAYNKHKEHNEKFEKFKLMLELSTNNTFKSNDIPKKIKSTNQLYNKNGKLVKLSLKDNKQLCK